MAETPRRALLLAAPLLMAAAPTPADAFGFRLTALGGGELDLGPFRGRPLLVTNTASFCGYTPQYAALQRVHERFEGRGLVVIGVPSNDFNQEASDEGTIREFCEGMFGIDFPMAGLTRVRGRDAHPFFRWAAERAGGPPRWNFHKYLVARDGLSVRAFATAAAPDGPEVTRAIEAALAATS
jgi:glutathione peroxidase